MFHLTGYLGFKKSSMVSDISDIYNLKISRKSYQYSKYSEKHKQSVRNPLYTH